MIQFNLLPAVKLEYVQSKRSKHVAVFISGLVAVIALGILILLVFYVKVLQQKHSTDLSKDIKTESSKLEGQKDLAKILTVQNQLNTLSTLHDSKPAATRLLGFIKQLTPANVSVATLSVDLDAHTIAVAGAADSLPSINKFADTLKFTSYKTADGKEGKAFSEVVLGQFGKDAKGASYRIAFKYDQIIFSGASEITLDIPAGKITTRSQTEKPESLFQPLQNVEDK